MRQRFELHGSNRFSFSHRTGTKTFRPDFYQFYKNVELLIPNQQTIVEFFNMTRFVFGDSSFARCTFGKFSFHLSKLVLVDCMNKINVIDIYKLSFRRWIRWGKKHDHDIIKQIHTVRNFFTFTIRKALKRIAHRRDLYHEKFRSVALNRSYDHT